MLNLKQFGPYNVVSIDYLSQGKETELLHENNYNGEKQYYVLNNYTTFLDKIEPSDKNEKMSKLSLVFNNGERATTHAYLDDPNIREKSFVSIIGYTIKRNNEFQLFCRGITPIYTNIDELLNADLDKYVKVDLVINLSDIKESTVYYASDRIHRIEGTNYYYTEKTDIQSQVKQFLINFKGKQQEKEEQKEIETTEEQTIETKVDNTDINITENAINDVIDELTK